MGSWSDLPHELGGSRPENFPAAATASSGDLPRSPLYDLPRAPALGLVATARDQWEAATAEKGGEDGDGAEAAAWGQDGEAGS